MVKDSMAGLGDALKGGDAPLYSKLGSWNQGVNAGASRSQLLTN